MASSAGQYSWTRTNSQQRSSSTTTTTSATTASSFSSSAIATAPPPPHPPPWSSCVVCSPNLPFRSPIDFAKHLRQCHASKEGGSFVCHYGVNGVCPSLPLEGVSDRDYEDHVRKNHVMEDLRGGGGRGGALRTSKDEGAATISARKDSASGGISISSLPSKHSQFPPAPPRAPSTAPSTDGSTAEKWTVYDATTNVASVLSDPHRARPAADFFTRTWGDAFGKTTVSPSPLLPSIDRSHFQRYLDKTGGRCRRRRELKATERQGGDFDDGGVGALRRDVSYKEQEERKRALEEVPKIFFRPNFSLEDPNVFNEVFSHWSKMSPTTTTTSTLSSAAANSVVASSSSTSCGSKQSSKLLQEKLSHYLDIVEQAINDQIASRSDAFFHALASHDELQDHMARTKNSIQNLRSMMKKLEDVHVRQPLTVLSLAKKRETSYKVFNKLKTMSTVHATQQTIQLLLATSDYVSALDLIAATQEVLANELVGVHCFRYLGTQLSEIEKVIDKMLVEDFVAYSQSDLNRPINVEEKEFEKRRKKTDGDGGMNEEAEYPGVGLRFDATGRILKQSSPSDDAEAEDSEDTEVSYIDVAAHANDDDDDNDPLVPEEERLVALVLGMLRLNKFNFIDVYKTEIASATKSLIRRSLTERLEKEPIEIETLPEQDANVAGLADEMRLMTFRQWLPLMDLIFRRVVVFLKRVKAAHHVMCDVVRLAAGKSDNEGDVDNKEMNGSASATAKSKSSNLDAERARQSPSPTKTVEDRLQSQRSQLLLPVETATVALNLKEDEYNKLLNRIRELLWFACDHAQDRCIKVIASRAKSGYMDKISSSEFVQLCKMVESFAVACERLCGRRGTALRSSLTSQAAKFVNRFHEERKTKLCLILDSERWKPVEVSPEFQKMADDAFRNGELLPPTRQRQHQQLHQQHLSDASNASSSSTSPRLFITVNDEPYAVVGTVLLLMRMMADYCKCIGDIPSTAPEILTKLVELLKTFNSRTNQLVMGAGALQLNVGLKTISTKNLALASRSLQLALLLVTLVKRKYIDGVVAVEGTSAVEPPLSTATSQVVLNQSKKSNNVVGEKEKDDDETQSSPRSTEGTEADHSNASSVAAASSNQHLLALTKSRRLTLTRQFNQLEKSYQDHVASIRNKFVSIIGSMLERDLETWEVKAPVPSPVFRSIGRQLVKFHEAIADLLPKPQIKIIFAEIHHLLLSYMKSRLRQQGIFNDGGPKHGLVMTELAFYLENLKSLNGLDAGDFVPTERVWTIEPQQQQHQHLL